MTTCQCPQAGWCSIFGRQMSQRQFQVCRGDAHGLTPAECDTYRANWMAMAWAEGYTAPLACSYRGDQIDTRTCHTCGHRGEKAALFHCDLHGKATFRPWLVGQTEAICAHCPDRKVFAPQLLDRLRIDPFGLLPSDYQFNNSLVRYKGRLLMAYRVHWHDARLALCELDESLRPFRNWWLGLENGHAQEDPRLFIYRGRLHVSFTAVYSKPGKFWTDVCYARLAESADGTWGVKEEFFPKYPGRAAWEKNWGFFEHQGDLLAVYSIKPHRILRIEGNKADLIAESQCDFRKKPGLLHGGAPPVFHRGEYYCFFHRRLGASQEKFYSIDLYTFEGQPPFRPSRHIYQPLLIPDVRDRPAPAVPHAIFPGGAFIDQQHRWTVSFGYYDKWSEVAQWGINQIESCLAPLPGSPMASVIARKGTNDLAMWKEVHDWNEYGLPDAFTADDVIVDVGAHIGSFTRACLDRGAGIVIACEPYPPSFELLKQNCAYYVHKADLCQVAVGAKRGTLTLRNRDRSGTSHVAVSGHFRGGPVVCESSVVPLNEVMPPGRIRLLKLDCEGAEYDIAASADLGNVEEIVGEAHRVEWREKEATIGDLVELLAAKGFAVEFAPLGESAWLFKAERRRS